MFRCLDMPPETEEERNSGRLNLCSLHPVSRDKPFQKANEGVHTLLSFWDVLRGANDETEEVGKGVIAWHMFDQFIEKQSIGHGTHSTHDEFAVERLH